MMAGKLVASLVLVASFAAIVSCDLAPPKLLSADNIHKRQLHIQSEIFDSDGGYESAEELVDLNLGKALYSSRTEAEIRTSWLIDANQNAMHAYKPFTCKKYDLTRPDKGNNNEPLPLYIPSIRPSIQIANDKVMNLYGISALLQHFSETPGWRHSRAFNHSGMAAGHSWTLTDPTGSTTIKLLFSNAGRSFGVILQLDAIEISEASRKRTIMIKSIIDYINAVDYTKLELPLIYGCKGYGISNDDSMRRAYEAVASNQSARHHLRFQAWALSLSGADTIISEQNNIELAVSDMNNGENKKLFMLQHRNLHSNIKTLIDYTAGTKIISNLRSRRKCEFSKLNSSPSSSSSPSSQQPLEIRFGNDLVMPMENIESLIYGVTPETLLRLTRINLGMHAYFVEDFPDMFGPRSLGRVLRRFDVSDRNESRLHSFAVWAFERDHDDEQQTLLARKMFDFKLVEEKLLASAPDNARAFDMSQDCYINNDEMVYGQDYVRVTINYVTDQLNGSTANRDWLEAIFQEQIKKVTGMNFLRVPKLHFTFGEYSFSLEMLVLDTLPPHLVYYQANSYTLDPADIDMSVSVTSLEECSRLCKRFRCAAMTFPSDAASPGLCSLARHPIGSLEPSEGLVAYSSDSLELERTILSGLGLGEPDDSIQEEQTNRALRVFAGLKVTFQSVEDAVVILAPARLRVET